MPRVTQEHRDARRRQILDAARTCFVRNGFHATSMQDVFTEAGLSAGAVYRYFASKSELIGAIAATKIGDITAALDDVPADDPPPLEEALGRVFVAIRDADDREGIAKLISQVWSEAIRSPEIAEVLRANIGIAFTRMARVAEIYQRTGVLAADVPPQKLARAMAGLVQGFIMQLTLLQDVDVEDFKLGVRGLVAGDVRSAG